MTIRVTTGQNTFIKKIVVGTPISTAVTGLSIDQFNDFKVSTKSDAQILVYDSSEQAFKNFDLNVDNGLEKLYTPGNDRLLIRIDSSSSPIISGLTSHGSLLPGADSAYNLGDSDKKWKDLFLSGTTIHLGGLLLKDSGDKFGVKDSAGSVVNIDLAGSVPQIRGFFSAGGDLSYNSSTGVFSFDVEQVYTKANFDSDFNLAIDEAALGGVGLAYDAATNTIKIDSAEFTANFSTTNLPEGTNQYYTTARADSDAKASLFARSIGGGDGNFTYDSSSGVMTYTGPSASETRAHFTGDKGLVYSNSTGIFSVDSANLKSMISVTDAGGDGALAYNAANGVITYTGPSPTQVRAHFSGQGDITYDSATGVFSIDVEQIYTKSNFDSDLGLANTAQLPEGTNLYYTTARTDSDAKASLLGIDAGGDGSFTYDSATGVMTYTGPSASEVRAHITAGEGIDISSGAISGEDATVSNKGIASFNTEHFAVSSGAVSVKANGIDDTHIDFGTGTNQVSTADLPEQTNLYYTAARTTALIDSAYVQARTAAGTDSAATQSMIDSNFANTITFANDIIFDSAGGIIFDKSDKALEFGDDHKASFGTGGDLVIRHNKANNTSYIEEAGAGDLVIKADDLYIQNAAGTENMAIFQENGYVQLRHNHSVRFQTSDSGVSITGELTADSATIGGLRFPKADGSNNHVLKTDGSGNLSFASVTALSGNIDSSAVIVLVDSAYVQARTAAGTDSAATQAMIDSSIGFQVDSSYVQARQVGSAITIQEEASSLSTAASTLNFVGSGVTATGSGATKTITIPGSASGSIGSINNVKADTFAGNGSNKAFTLSNTPVDSDDVLVFINGILQHTNTYGVSGVTLTLDSAPSSSDEIETRTHLIQSVNLILRDHKSYIYTLGATSDSVSGNDSAGVSLAYDVGKVDVFANGVRLVTGKDFTAANGTSIVFDSALSSGNIIEVVSHAKATTTDLNGIFSIDSDLTSTDSAQIIHSFNKTIYRTVKYTAQLENNDSSGYHSEEILLVHNGTSVAMTSYAKILLDSDLGTFDARISGDNVQLTLSPTKINTHVKLRAIRTPV